MSTVTYHHSWAAPHVVALEARREGQAPERVWTARQECERCGTERNPFTDRITKYRGRKDENTGLHPCQTDEPVRYRWADEEKRVARDLKAMDQDGHKVRVSHPDPAAALERELF